MKYYFLQYQTTHPERHERYTSLKYAKEAFLEVASELARHGQRSLATVHIAPTRCEIGEYPDYFLELGPRGAVKCMKT